VSKAAKVKAASKAAKVKVVSKAAPRQTPENSWLKV